MQYRALRRSIPLALASLALLVAAASPAHAQDHSSPSRSRLSDSFRNGQTVQLDDERAGSRLNGGQTPYADDYDPNRSRGALSRSAGYAYDKARKALADGDREEACRSFRSAQAFYGSAGQGDMARFMAQEAASACGQ